MSTIIYSHHVECMILPPATFRMLSLTMKLYFTKLDFVILSTIKPFSLWSWHFNNSRVNLVCPETFKSSGNAMMRKDYSITASVWSPEDGDNNSVGSILDINYRLAKKRTQYIEYIGGCSCIDSKLWKDQAIHYFVNSSLLHSTVFYLITLILYFNKCNRHFLCINKTEFLRSLSF